MSTLFLVRHGQASFGADDYDVLSDLGHEQARLLGGHLVARGHRVDALYAGPARRHRDTAAGIVAGAAAAGVILPAPIELAGLDEYPAIELGRRWLTAEARAAVAGDPDRLAGAYDAIVARWIAGELDDPELERYAAFAARVEAALRAIIAREGRGRRVLVVTSGGPIGQALRFVLRLDDATAMRLAWVVANGSLTELRYREGELALIGFNHAGHLDHRTTTYR